MTLPELLYEWAEGRAKDRQQKLEQAVMIVFPTQFGCLKIRDSLLEFRGHDYWTVNLGTGIDKNDRFHWEGTKFQLVTYGMLWQWLVKGGQRPVASSSNRTPPFSWMNSLGSSRR